MGPRGQGDRLSPCVSKYPPRPPLPQQDRGQEPLLSRGARPWPRGCLPAPLPPSPARWHQEPVKGVGFPKQMLCPRAQVARGPWKRARGRQAPARRGHWPPPPGRAAAELCPPGSHRVPDDGPAGPDEVLREHAAAHRALGQQEVPDVPPPPPPPRASSPASTSLTGGLVVGAGGRGGKTEPYEGAGTPQSAPTPSLEESGRGVVEAGGQPQRRPRGQRAAAGRVPWLRGSPQGRGGRRGGAAGSPPHDGCRDSWLHCHAGSGPEGSGSTLEASC